MDTAGDFPRIRREAAHALTDLNEAINATYGITAWERFDYDLQAGTLIFSHKGRPRVVVDIQLVGSTDTDFLWAWANAGWWPAALLEDVRKVKAWGEAQGVAELTAPRLTGDNPNELGWAMTAVAAKITGALGAYQPMDGQRSLFFLYRRVGFVGQAGSVTALSRTTPTTGRQAGARKMSL